MADFFVTRKPILTEADLQNAEFAALSPIARNIFESSDVPYAAALLDPDPEKAREAQLELARRYFTINHDG
jgi:hypothetical protein